MNGNQYIDIVDNYLEQLRKNIIKSLALTEKLYPSNLDKLTTNDVLQHLKVHAKFLEEEKEGFLYFLM